MTTTLRILRYELRDAVRSRALMLYGAFFLVATADAEGNCDVSPKGDPSGAVTILDRRTIAIPDRAGNRRADGHRNLLANPHVGLIFIIPNVD